MKSAFVLATILESKLTLAFKYIIFKVSFISSLRFCEIVNTIARKLIIVEISFIITAIRPFVTTSSLFLSLDVLTAKLYFSVLPSFFAKTVLLVLNPFTIRSSTSSIHYTAVAVCHTILPVPLVNISIWLSHTTSTAHFIIFKLTYVLRAIWPGENTKSIHDEFSIYFTPFKLIVLNLDILTIVLKIFFLFHHQYLQYMVIYRLSKIF